MQTHFAPYRFPTSLSGLRGMIAEDLQVAREIFLPLDVTKLNTKPTPESWSAAQCLAHVVATDRLYLDRLEPRIRAASTPSRSKASDGELRGSRFGRWFAGQAGPTLPRKFKAPKKFSPSTSEIEHEVVGEFIDVLERLDRLVAEAASRDLERIVISSPITVLLRLRASDALRLLVCHGRRHLLQAMRAAEATEEAT